MTCERPSNRRAWRPDLEKNFVHQILGQRCVVNNPNQEPEYPDIVASKQYPQLVDVIGGFLGLSTLTAAFVGHIPGLSPLLSRLRGQGL
jgi:hypothetical protein